jgi:hypothetical protein
MYIAKPPPFLLSLLTCSTLKPGSAVSYYTQTSCKQIMSQALAKSYSSINLSSWLIPPRLLALNDIIFSSFSVLPPLIRLASLRTSPACRPRHNSGSPAMLISAACSAESGVRSTGRGRAPIASIIDFPLVPCD